MNNNCGRKRFCTVLDVVAESVSFILLTYLLSFFLLSFRANVFYILLMATNVFIAYKYWLFLRGAIRKKVVSLILFSVSVCVVVALVYTLGYLPIPTEFRRF
jgi:small-conductance mechanosensitive channel